MRAQQTADEADWTGVGDEKRRAGFEWGLASVLMGGLLMLMAPIQLVCNLLIWNSGNGIQLGSSDLSIAYIAACIGVPGVFITAIISLVFGIRGFRRARWFDQPVAIPLAGIFLSLAAVFLWLVVGANLILILRTFL